MLIKLNGRNFQVMNQAGIPFRVDAAQVALLQELGLDAPDKMPQTDEDPVAYISRLNEAVIKTGRIPELLSHYLIPDGKTEADWTPALAAETQAAIENVTDPQERALVYELSAEFVFGFFRRGVAWLETSQSFLELSLAMAAPSESRGVRSILGRGRAWCARLLGLTSTRRVAYPSGPFEKA